MDARPPAAGGASHGAVDPAAEDPSSLGATDDPSGAASSPPTDAPSEPASRPERNRAPHSVRRRILEWLGVIAMAVLGALALRTFVVETFSIPSGSMYPTLQVGDRILVDRLPFLAHSIHRGDVIVFKRVPADNDPTQPADLVKRVIGLPGETISSQGDTVLINGHPIAEPWLPNLRSSAPQWACYQSSFDIPKTTIGAGQYFVMGDCRGNSFDSRDWGTVPSSYIIGRVFLVIWRHGHPWFHWF